MSNRYPSRSHSHSRRPRNPVDFEDVWTSARRGDRLSWGGQEYLVTKAKQRFWQDRPTAIEVRALDASAPGGLGTTQWLTGEVLPMASQRRVRGADASQSHTWQMPGLSPLQAREKVAAQTERERMRAERERLQAERRARGEARQADQRAKREAREAREAQARADREAHQAATAQAAAARQADREALARDRLAAFERLEDAKLAQRREVAQQRTQQQELGRQTRAAELTRREAQHERDRQTREAGKLGFLGRSASTLWPESAEVLLPVQPLPPLSRIRPPPSPDVSPLPSADVGDASLSLSPERKRAMQAVRDSGYGVDDVRAAFAAFPDKGDAQIQAAHAFRALVGGAGIEGIRTRGGRRWNPGTYRGGLTTRFAAAAQAAAQARGLSGEALTALAPGAASDLARQQLQDQALAAGQPASLADDVWNAARAATKRRAAPTVGLPWSSGEVTWANPAAQVTLVGRNPVLAVFALTTASLIVWGWAQQGSAQAVVKPGEAT